ncbi:GNAT family N-acetyltransferase [Naasia aerilata]|uniref:GNAT family N-acetyltransferase n=1 Tax=Naasia aerilata TaxID=1162966 RepID=A0ABM8GDL3_9MICO|nr:GNAT family N-acetyltransferase [Naasia aerilata]BDZ46333.1 GNAT family N-acetyltransferase [Naasia aerilata]
MTVPGLEIELLQIPASIAEDDGSWAEMVRVRNETEAAALGSFDLAPDPGGLLIEYHDRWFDRRIYLARMGGRIVGRGFVELPLEDGSCVAVVEVEVHPDWRGRGIGAALLEVGERKAAEAHRDVLQAWIVHTRGTDDEPRVAPPTGFGSLPAADPGVRFLREREWTLEQIYRISRLDLAASVEATADGLRRGRESAGDDYDVVVWAGATPEERLEDQALLYSRMSTDAPQAGVEVDEEVWTAERVRDNDARAEEGGYLLLTAAVRHRETDRLVGFTNVYIPADRSRPAQQGDTLVLSEHRGHRLGLLVKASLHAAIAEHSPATGVICTFNAEENRYMLGVNEALGFVPIGYQGVWQKKTLEAR